MVCDYISSTRMIPSLVNQQSSSLPGSTDEPIGLTFFQLLRFF